MIRGKYLRERKAIKFKRRFKLLVAITIVLIVYRILCDSFSLFESQANSDNNIDIAFFLVNDRYSISKEDGSYEYTKRVNITDLKPGDSKTYKIWISNYAFLNENEDSIELFEENSEGKKKVIADTNIEYTLKIRATTNLPLEYKLGSKEENVKKDITPEVGGIYFYNIFTVENRKLTIENAEGEQDTYELEITFPEEYKDAKYQDIIEYIEVSIDAKQIVEN